MGNHLWRHFPLKRKKSQIFWNLKRLIVTQIFEQLGHKRCQKKCNEQNYWFLKSYILYNVNRRLYKFFFFSHVWYTLNVFNLKQSVLGVNFIGEVNLCHYSDLFDNRTAFNNRGKQVLVFSKNIYTWWTKLYASAQGHYKTITLGNPFHEFKLWLVPEVTLNTVCKT